MGVPELDGGFTDAAQRKRLERVTVVWMGTMIVLFPLLVTAGYFMRMFQSKFFPTMRPEWFYAVLTLHGLGMVMTWFVGGMAAASYMLGRYVRPSLAISWINWWATLAGLGLLTAATLGGLFGTGWYFLYPLPFYSQGVWPAWATGCFFGALAIWGVAWLVWVLDLLRAILRRYGIKRALAWPVLAGRNEEPVPPLVLISTVTLLPCVVALVAAASLLVLFLMQWFVPGFIANALIMKNITFLFGHLLVNLTLYLGVAVVYEMLPRFAGRPWKTSRAVAIGWNIVLVMVVFAYFHHLYMDFVQPPMAQMMGQMMSYMGAIPASAISIFGGLLLVYGARMRWTLGSAFMFLGLLGWAFGGVGGVIDATIAVNFRFHNTLWVPAHFHTYYLLGVVLMLLGFASELGSELGGKEEPAWVRRSILALFLTGGYGFVMMFFWAGAHSIPRRYAMYRSPLTGGTLDARVAVGFITLVLIASLIFLWDVGVRCWRGVTRA